ncbi:phage GP46 family protein [Neptunomonas antarctica]|uniref:Mu-like prophage protein gp46 n=1 Tax=Neptunomonas antarctica TaxID=619304 RepID=A0A1N7MNP9_9GAMM|nr:phage GP46 family protein [Neptunomonas antarctica]SIS87774.1 Mu-like prophage protein gp46 [Neptunomonas antarctica]
MTMLALAWSDLTQQIDLQARPSDRLTWLENAVTISLFTDARASADDALPDGGVERRGYWGDIDLPEGESLGSKLWLLAREKVTPPVINKARDYCSAALSWMVDDGHLLAVNVDAQRGALDRIEFEINCQLPDGSWIALLREHYHVV